MELKKREIQYDYLRALAVFAIIMVHAIPAETLNSRQWLLSAALMPVLLAFVGIYFMLSGMFILKSGTEDIPKFYRNRFQTIFVPFACYSGIYYWYYKLYLGEESLSWQEHLAAYMKGLLTGTIPMASHMWFMYVILALYLCAPFLARMLKAMSDRELKIFLGLMLVVQGLCTYLPALGLEVGESLQYMVFKGWVIYFILGYACRRLYHSGHYLPFAILGIAGFGITMFQKCFMPDFTPGIHDLAPAMIAMALAIFLFFESFGNVRIPVLVKAAGFVSRYSYSIYLIHYLVLGQFVRGLVERTSIRHYYVPRILCETALTFLVSLIAAWILDETIVKLLKKAVGAGYYNRKNG
ncbi:acyltransferase [Clostridium sp. Marseille-P2415]|uniref:acyltransferase n=1 Tax=Clostridium sp. Marseille-P2415 TaxID=1805471 RepID=UPI0009883931|nr:acyltransferase [Clostridium sp. Marseille-P2415]